MYNSILVVIDQLIKMGWYVPINATIDAIELVEVFINTIFKDYGTLVSITSNRGP